MGEGGGRNAQACMHTCTHTHKTPFFSVIIVEVIYKSKIGVTMLGMALGLCSCVPPWKGNCHLAQYKVTNWKHLSPLPLLQCCSSSTETVQT